MAVLKFSSVENYPTLSIRSSDLVDSKSTLFVAGWPLAGNRKSAKISIGKLIASSAIEVENGYSLIYTNKTSPGMSEGPVVNRDNQIVGLHGRVERSEGLAISTLKTGITQGVTAFYLQ